MSPQAGWMLVDQIVPRLKVLILKSVSTVGAEDVDELVQDSTLMAARMLNSAEKKGKRVTAGSIAHYTLLHLRSGRRSYASGSSCCMHPVNRMRNSEPYSLDDVVTEDADDQMTLNDVLSVENSDPSVEAARNIDWTLFLQRQNSTAKAIIICLVEGRQLKTLTRKLNINQATIQNETAQLARRLLAFMGVDVVADSTRPPRWKNNLHAINEQLACREERKSC